MFAQPCPYTMALRRANMLAHLKADEQKYRWANALLPAIVQRTHITMGQYWPNVMHPTQLSHVKTSHRCTLAQRWANVLIPTSYRSDCQ